MVIRIIDLHIKQSTEITLNSIHLLLSRLVSAPNIRTYDSIGNQPHTKSLVALMLPLTSPYAATLRWINTRTWNRETTGSLSTNQISDTKRSLCRGTYNPKCRQQLGARCNVVQVCILLSRYVTLRYVH
eukprot:SAG11_NODE_17955_length_504_cov_1.108642_1_plen_129_part_00